MQTSTTTTIVETSSQTITLQSIREALASLTQGIPFDAPPAAKERDPSVPHAPARCPQLSHKDKKLAIANALRYFPPKMHAELAPEFAEELEVYGHIYMHRFRPTHYRMKAYPIDLYPANCKQGNSFPLTVKC